jgi:hypothetical protein
MNKLIILFVLLLILFVFFLKKNGEQMSEINGSDLYNGYEWADYRIGDVVKLPLCLINEPPHNILYHLYSFKGSLAEEYLKRKYPTFFGNINSKSDIDKINKQELEKYIKENEETLKYDFALLNTIIKERKNNNENVDNNTLVLHIRIGDVICFYENGKKGPGSWENADFYSKQGNEQWWDDVVDYIKDNGVTKIIIIAGEHRNMCLQKSADYIRDRYNFLTQKTDLPIELRLGKSPDEDIMLVSNTPHFITTGGGYGEILKNIYNK